MESSYWKSRWKDPLARNPLSPQRRNELPIPILIDQRQQGKIIDVGQKMNVQISEDSDIESRQGVKKTNIRHFSGLFGLSSYEYRKT
jgi:hypothetical protein